MAYKLELTSAAERDLDGLQKKDFERIDAAILGLAHEPRPRGALKLKGTKNDLLRIRVGNFRVLYRVDDEKKAVEIARVVDRKDVYRTR